MPKLTPTAPSAVGECPPVRIGRRLAMELLHAAQLSPAAEICGLISARDGEPLRFYPVDNIAEDPASTFEMDAAGLTSAMRTLRERGEALFAVFHSHPTAPAEPSGTDFERSGYPQSLQMIASLNTKGVLQLRCWQWAADGAPQERVLIAA